MKRKSLLVLLVLAVLCVTAGGIWRLLWLGQRVNSDGPLALAIADDRGLFLATDSAILRFNADGTPAATHSAASLGLRQPGALQQDDDRNLWVFDKELRQIFRCDSTWQCHGITPAALDLDKNIQFSVNTQRRQIAVADNNRHRLLLLDLQGRLLHDSNDNPPLHYPNQVSLDTHSLLIADTDRRNILSIPLSDTGATVFGTPLTSLHTSRRPYRFVHDATGWWVLEAGETLFQGQLVHYAENGTRKEIDSAAQDIIDIADGGNNIVVASRSDYRLLAIDKADGLQHELGGEKLVAEWTGHRLQQTAWRQERKRIPLFMLVVLLPTLLGASALQKQVVAEQEEARAREAGAEPPPAAAGYVVMHPDAVAKKTIRMEFIANLAASTLVVVFIPGISWLAAGMPPPSAWGKHELWPLLVVSLLTIPLALASFAFAIYRRNDRLSGEIVFELHRVLFNKKGKNIATASYDKVSLTQASLEIGKVSVPLYYGNAAGPKAFWPRATIKAVLDARKGAPPKLAARPGGARLGMADSERARVIRQRWLLRGYFLLASGFMFFIFFQTLSKNAHAGWPLYVYGGGSPIIILGIFLFMERRLSGLLQREIFLSSSKLIVFEKGRPVISATPDQIFLGGRTLVVKSRGIPVFFENGLRQRTEYLPAEELRSLLGEMLPPDHIFATDPAMILALLKRRHPYAIVQTLMTVTALVLAFVILWFNPRHRH